MRLLLPPEITWQPHDNHDYGFQFNSITILAVPGHPLPLIRFPDGGKLR